MQKTLRATTLAVLVLSLTVLVGGGISRAFRFEGLSDYGEGTVLAAVERFEREGPSPGWLEGPEITLAPYGPGYYAGVAIISRALPWEHTLLPGRLLSLLATWLTALLIAVASGRACRSWEIGLAGAVVFLASPVAHTWGGTHRVDALATLFAVASYVAAGAGRKGLVLSAVLIVAGSLVKQTVALSALGVFVWLLVDRRPREALVYFKVVAGLGLSSWWILDRATGGYALASALAGNLGRMSPARGVHGLLDFVSAPFVVGTLWVLWQELARPEGRAAPSRYVVGLVSSMFTAALMTCKEGSAPCYFLEASALAALVFAGQGLRTLIDRPRVLWLGLTVLGMTLAVDDAAFLFKRGWTFETVAYHQSFLAKRWNRGDWVLADGQHLPAVLAAEARPMLNDPFYFRQMADRGRLSPELIAGPLERGEVTAIVLKQPIEAHRREIGTESQKWPVQVLDAMESRYEFVEETPGMYLYGRKPRQTGGVVGGSE